MVRKMEGEKKKEDRDHKREGYLRCEVTYKFTSKIMLRSGFEPESSARKAEMIGRATLPEQNCSFKNKKLRKNCT